MVCGMLAPSRIVRLSFLQRGYCKVKKKNKSQANAHEYYYLGPAPNYLRARVLVISRHRTVLFAQNVTWQCMSATPHVPVWANDSLSTEEGGSKVDDVSTSDRGGRGGGGRAGR